jgi:hypothetical protein
VKAPESASDPAFANYHALVPIPSTAIAALSAPGATTATFTVTLDTTFATAAALFNAADAPCILTAMLPPAALSGTKAKPCEAALAPQEDGQERCGWKGARLEVQVTLTNPVVPAWKPPPKPTRSLAEIVPPRNIEQVLPPSSASNQYKNKVAGAPS